MAWSSFYNHFLHHVISNAQMECAALSGHLLRNPVKTDRYLFPGPHLNMSPHSPAAHCPYLNRFILPVMNKKEEAYIPDNYSSDTYDSWKSPLVVHWSSHDVFFWMISQLYELGVKNVPAVKLEHLHNINGTTLKHLSLHDFRKLIPDYGDDLYHSLQCRLSYEARVLQDSVQKVYIPLEVAHRPQSPIQLQGSGIDLINTTCVEKWAEKSITSWTPSDTLEWMVSQLMRLGVREPAALQLQNFDKTSGGELLRLSLAEFTRRLPSHGDQLYHQLQVKIQAESQLTDSHSTAGEVDLSVHFRKDAYSHVDNKGENSSVPKSKVEKKSSLKENVQLVNEVKKAKAQDKEKVGRVWEFIRQLLLDSRNQDVISWVDREAGVFRFENSAKAAKLWGDRKGNSLMNFKKFSRAIRYNYKMGYLSGVKKNRLIYKFGPKSHGWKLQNT